MNARRKTPPAPPRPRNPYVAALARVMRVQREGLFITQQRASGRVGMAQQQWNRLEAGRQKDVTISCFVSVAAALEVRAAELMTLVEHEIRSRPEEYNS